MSRRRPREPGVWTGEHSVEKESWGKRKGEKRKRIKVCSGREKSRPHRREGAPPTMLIPKGGKKTQKKKKRN